MQDLTLINAEDELSLHTSDVRMRRDAMDDLSSGSSTLPRAKSTRQSKASTLAQPTLLFNRGATWTSITINTFWVSSVLIG